MKNLRYFIEYIPVRAFDLFFQIWPRSWALRMGELLGVLMSFVILPRRRLVLKNLSDSFPEKTRDEIRLIAGKFWRNLGRVAVEFIRVTDINRDNVDDFFIWEGKEHYDRAMSQEKGVIAIGFHFTNWEYCGLILRMAWNDVVAIARPMKNPYVEKWVQGKRGDAGMEIILHRNAVRAGLKTLKNKRSLGVLVDQNLRAGGVFVNFFGRFAATTTLPALLHSRTGAPVVLVYLLREGMKFRMVAEPPMEFPEAKEGEDWVKVHTQVISDHLERVIRRNPDMWFWIHNRWKRKPDVAPPGKTNDELMEAVES
jgi:Kdo2-lipid IVA lauroyltransferase/acyltransferase